MQLHVTKNKFNPDPFYTESIKSVFAAPLKESVSLFDQNGYDLTKLEQMYAVANGYDLTEHRNDDHITLRNDWFIDQNPADGPHINHAYMFERKGFTQDALSQLQSWSSANTHLHKLIAMKPKWGLDFSIDYCDQDGNVFEVLHWEFDGFEYQEIADKKQIMDQFLVQQDWQHSAKQILKHKDDWHHLGFFEQSEWKTRYFGIDKERFKMVLWK
tara:strand:- start:713 stop:1354 length:642 start_codon:yes stop_codon:yes gene_type:complete